MMQSKRITIDKSDQKIADMIVIQDSLYLGYYNMDLVVLADKLDHPPVKKIHLGGRGILSKLSYDLRNDQLIINLRDIRSRYQIYDLNLKEKLHSGNCKTPKLKLLNQKWIGYGNYKGILHTVKDKLNTEFIFNDSTRFLRDVCSHQNEILFATDNGVVKLDDNLTLINIKPNLNSISCEHISSNDKIVATSSQKGVHVWNQNEWSTIDFSNGLLSTDINDITLVDDFLFIGTAKGLNFCSLAGELKQLQIGNLLEGKKIYCLLAHQQSLFVSAIDGLYKIPFSAFKVENTKPQLILRSVINDKKLVSLENDKVIVSRDAPYVEVNVLAEDISQHGTFEYQYKKDQSEWIPFNDGKLLLSNLNPGITKIEIRANHYNSVFSSPIVFDILTPKYIYEHWWFYLIIAAILGLMLERYLAYSRRKHAIAIKTLDRELRLNQQVLQAKMNPHFVFNSLNTLKMFILKEEKNNASNYLGEFSNLLRKIFNYNRSDTISLKQELDYLQSYCNMESKRFEEDFSIDFNVEKGLNLEHIIIPALIIQPVIENAFWHGLAHSTISKKMEVSVNLAGELLVVKVSDNGIGFDNSFALKSDIEHQETNHSLVKTNLRLSLLSKLHRKEFSLENMPVNPENDTNPGNKTTIKLSLLNKSQK